VEQHSEGVKLLRGLGDTGAHRVMLSMVVVSRSRAPATTARTQSRGALRSGQEVMRCRWETQGGEGDACSWLAAPGNGESLGHGSGRRISNMNGHASSSRWSRKPPYRPGRHAEDETAPDSIGVLEVR
jgi:hypothetical protein